MQNDEFVEHSFIGSFDVVVVVVVVLIVVFIVVVGFDDRFVITVGGNAVVELSFVEFVTVVFCALTDKLN